ncbi:hypothetical protein GCM10010441_29770 [Kitasatospora paracochleata]|uniref:Uncharacterized protein n=1 Tax=Kitasatospora paracochleata TaxID=58354 RepID=A0ABT1J912_9ACTN|nr:hypothetical protein [Kitasatospora paracochleata]MCP2313935.1 hypothetical protein [Kitasatospora paracochleata]
MTSSSELAKLTLTSDTPGALLSIVDSTLRQVASGYGFLREQLAPGVYRIQARLGGTNNTHLISLAPGSSERRDLTVPFPSAAPVYGTSTEKETHGELTEALSESVSDIVGPDAGVVLILRNLCGSPAYPLYRNEVTLLDSNLREVNWYYNSWILADPEDAAGLCGRFPPGPYVLRTVGLSPEGNSTTDQAIWLSAGWQTVVFIPNGPRGPEARGLSVHMVPHSKPWNRLDPISLEVEAALAGLRDGIPSIPQELPGQLVDGRITNPMLGILGLHTLLLDTYPDLPDDGLSSAVANVEELLWPPHPDALAIEWVLPPEDRAPMSVPWPPMLASSYRRLLLPADLEDSRVLPTGSPSERVAPYLRPSEPWLQWSSTPDLLTERYTGGEPPWLGGWHVEAVTEQPEIRAPGAAVATVDRVLAEIAGFLEMERGRLVEQLGTQELARRCGLPESLVTAALRELGVGRPIATVST